MFDFDLYLNGGEYQCVSISAATTSLTYSKEIGFNFKVVGPSNYFGDMQAIPGP